MSIASTHKTATTSPSMTRLACASYSTTAPTLMIPAALIVSRVKWIALFAAFLENAQEFKLEMLLCLMKMNVRWLVLTIVNVSGTLMIMTLNTAP